MANEIWTIKRCLEWTKEYLAERGEEHPRLSAEWLLCAATGLARIDLYMRMDEMLDAAQLETMHAAVVRRAKGEPLQYITGSTQFRMIDVACAPGVLIPRPETEMLVEEVLNYLDAEVLGPEAAARQRAELPWNDEVEQARKAEAALADERATAERRAENLTAADEAALGERLLKHGSAGGNVKQLQQYLIRLGYDLGKWGADGEFGGATELAVKAFQKDSALAADGQYGKKSHEALLQALKRDEEAGGRQAADHGGRRCDCGQHPRACAVHGHQGGPRKWWGLIVRVRNSP